MKTVLILSDTHGELDSRVEALGRDCDVAVHAGDVGSAAVLERLRRACPLLVAIRGNNDVAGKWTPDEHAVMRALPDQAEVELPGGRLMVVHGHRSGPVAGRHRRLRCRYAGFRAVVYGHSHRLCIDDGERPWVLNPGAAGRARTFGGPSALVLHAAPRRWRVRAYRFEPRGRAKGACRAPGAIA